MESTTSWLVWVFRTAFLFVLPLGFIIYIGSKKLLFNARVDKIPGPKTWPFLGNAKLMIGGDLAGTFLNLAVFSLNKIINYLQAFLNICATRLLKNMVDWCEFGSLMCHRFGLIKERQVKRFCKECSTTKKALTINLYTSGWEKDCSLRKAFILYEIYTTFSNKILLLNRR